MLNLWKQKGSTLISVSLDTVFRFKCRLPKRYFYQKYFTNFNSMSVKEGNIDPPDSVRGMKKLNRKLFTKTIKVPSLYLPCRSIKDVSNDLKKYTLKLQNFKPLCNINTAQAKTLTNSGLDVSVNDFKLLTLDPRIIQNYNDIERDDRETLENHGIKEDFFFHHDLCINYDNWKADEIFRAVIPPEFDSVSGYSIIGHIVHLNLKEHLNEYKMLIGEVLLDKVKCARTIVNKIDTIDNTYRNFKMEVLVGEKNFITKVRENKCLFELDFSQVYWNPRLSTEHERIVHMLKSGDIFYDVFAGVGPFSIPAAKKGCITLTNDLNPHSINWLQINIAHNKVKESNIQIFNKDASNFIKEDIRNHLLNLKPGRYNIHIAMNLPAFAPSFLNFFKNLFNEDEYVQIKKLPVPKIYVYCFSKATENNEKLARETIENALNLNLNEEIIDVFFVRNVAPNKEMFRVTLLLTEKILLNKKRTSTGENENIDVKRCHNYRLLFVCTGPDKEE